MRRLFRRIWWVLPPVLVLGVGYSWQVGFLQQQWSIAVGSEPSIDYPSVIDLGDRQTNDAISVRFEIKNRGGRELVIAQITSSCACGKLEQEIDGAAHQIHELRISPGGTAELRVSTTVRVDGTGVFSQVVSFQTNDPDQPEGRITITFRVTDGKVRLSPSAVQFGQLAVGQSNRQVVELFAADERYYSVSRVISTDPSRVTAQWIPAQVNLATISSERLLGSIELTPVSAQPQVLDALIQVEFSDPTLPPASVAVGGSVRRKLDVSPPSLVLPISTGSGDCYTGRCIVRSISGDSVSLELVTVPPNMSVTFPDAADGPTRLVAISWLHTADQGEGTQVRLVRVRATAGSESELLDIPVTCERR